MKDNQRIHTNLDKESNDSFFSNNDSSLSEISNSHLPKIEKEEKVCYNNSSQLTNKQSKIIRFQINNSESYYPIDITMAIKGYPNILSNIDINSDIMLLPEWMDIKSLKDYFSYIRLQIDVLHLSKEIQQQSLQFNFKKMTRLANYFENEPLLNQMIQSNIIPNINIENCISLLNDSYKHCQELPNEALKHQWMQLLLKIRKFIIKNFNVLLPNMTRLKTVNKRMLEDLIEHYLIENIRESTMSSNHITLIMNLLNYIRDITHDNEIDSVDNDNNSTNIFYLIQRERDKLNNETITNELKGNCVSYLIDLVDFFHNYQTNTNNVTNKIKQSFNKQEILFDTTYNAQKDEIVVSFRMNHITHHYKLLSFNAVIAIHEDKTKNKSMTNIISQQFDNKNNPVALIKISSFSNYVKFLTENKNSASLSLTITLKFNLIETFILHYLINNIGILYKCSAITLVPSNLLIPLLKITLEDINISNEKILSFLMVWLINDINIKDEDVVDLLEMIHWENIPLGKIFEFVIKFPQFLTKNSIESLLISSIINKANQKLFSNDGLSLKNEMNLHDSIQKNLLNNLQLSIMTYFFANLIECSKRIQYTQTLITLDNLLKQLKNSSMVISTVANNKLNNFSCNFSMQLQKDKLSQRQRTPNKDNPNANSTNRSIKFEPCDSDPKLAVILDNDIALCQKIIEAKYSDSKSDNYKRSTDSSLLRNKSDEAFNSQTSVASAQKTPSTKQNESSQMNVLNKAKQPIVDIFFHGTNNNPISKHSKVNGSRSISKVHVKSYK